MRYIAIGVLLALSYASANAATETESAFTATGNTCADITWKASVLERFPNIGVVCQAVVERDGKMYAQFKGTVSRRFSNTLYIRFEGGEKAPGGNRSVKIQPSADLTFRVGSRTYKVRDAAPGQDLTIYIPGDRFVVNLGDDIAPAEETEIVEIVPVSEEPAAAEEPAPAEEAPPPAEPAQPAEAAPPPTEPAPVAAETPPPETPATEPPAPKEGTPWLLIAGIVIVIIVIVVFVRRGRRST